jgi:hypothetical protein
MSQEHTSRSSENDQSGSGTQPGPQGAPLFGRVIDQSGEALANAKIAISGGTSPTSDIAVIADGEGRFWLPRLPSGRYIVTVLSVGGRRSDHELSISEGVAPQSLEIKTSG